VRQTPIDRLIRIHAVVARRRHIATAAAVRKFRSISTERASALKAVGKLRLLAVTAVTAGRGCSTGVETDDLAELVNATVVVNAEGGGEEGAAKLPNGAEVVETENAALSSVIRRQARNAVNHGERSMTLTLLAVVKRENMIDLKYGDAFDDPQPFILTVTHETAKSVPISASDLHAYILAHAAKLRATAETSPPRASPRVVPLPTATLLRWTCRASQTDAAPAC
jgi:hypothetical protein